MIVQRALAVLSAVLLVVAVGLATLGSETVSLGQAIGMFDNELVNALQGWAERHLGAWAWNDVEVPLLVRPAWLMPAALGLVCLGMSLSLGNRKSTHRSHRRS
ncbi:MAG TPA: hypothetical protein VIG49_14790 [Acetobacteraceae bacterium]